MQKNKPLIGITSDFLSLEEMSGEQCYVLRHHYFRCLSQNNALPIILGHDVQNIPYLCHLLDGLLFTGGNYDIEPSFYGQTIKSDKIVLNHSRSNFEINLFKNFFDTGKPILGICAGQQLMNVILGGTLIQNIEDEIPNALNHTRSSERKQPCHPVTIVKSTILFNILQTDKIKVNTSHRQAVSNLGKNVIINALASDNIIEGIEVTNHPFCLGIQWHPEYLVNPEENRIFEYFIESCIKR